MAYEPAVLRRAAARLRAEKEKRSRAVYQLRQRLYEECPELPRLDAALRGTMAEVAELALSHDPDCAAKLEEIKARNLSLQRERTELLARAGYGPDALDETPACPKCKDSGWTEDGMCRCLKELCIQEQLRQLAPLLEPGEKSFDRARLDVYSDAPWGEERRSPRQGMTDVIKLCEGYARQFPDYPLKNLFFSGGTGLGKTFLSACIARTVTQRGFSVVYDTAIHAFASFDERRFARDAEQERAAKEAVDRLLKCDLLILDDLGSETTTALVQSSLYELINSRLRPEFCTIISSNLSMEVIRDRYTPQIASRLEGEYREVTFYGADIRTSGRR